MELFAKTRSDLRRQRNLIPDMDLLIGATAVYHDRVLMTRNIRHFARIPNLELYVPS
jgi:tRNA(fMet)-specific endonuclease VapC